MHSVIFHNGRLLPLAGVRLSPGQAGLLNGWAIFTTMRLYDGLPFAPDRHWRRLTRDAGRLQLPLPAGQAAVEAGIRELVSANRVQDGCIRVYFVYNKVGFWTSDEPMPVTDFIMYSTNRPSRSGPADLAVQAHGRHAASPLSGVKVTSWLNNVWSLEQAHQRGFEEVVLLNEKGEVAECTAANIYAVRDNVITTPPLSAGCLAGVTREVLLEIGPAAGHPIREAPITLAELQSADEVFVTSTTREVQPVQRIEDHKPRLVNGPVTARMAATFSDFVRRSLEGSSAA